VAKIRAKVLESLSRIYAFGGSRNTPDSVDTEVGISVVHDVSAMTADNTGIFNGWYWASEVHGHVGAGTITSNYDILDMTGPLEEARTWVRTGDDFWHWVMKATASASVSSLADEALVGRQLQGRDFGIVGNTTELLTGGGHEHIARLTMFTNIQATDSGGARTVGEIAASRHPIAGPIGQRYGTGVFNFSSTSSGITNIGMNVLMWHGRSGVFPPSYRL